jgi:sigma-B regulation protein RsbU (phosphoserine phosphatase)
MMSTIWSIRKHRERNQYWKTVPVSSLTVLTLAVFLTFSSIAFVSDLGEPRPSPYWWVIVYAAATGIVAVGYTLASTRSVRMLPVALALNFLTIVALPKLLPLYASKVPAGTTVAQLHQRHVVDAMLVLSLITLGYMFVVTFVSTEGAKYFRLKTETELAQHVQAELVPPINMIASGLEICGKSIPSKIVGGDLVDAVPFGGELTCYVADVSGHGIGAAVLMSMVKSAVRTSISRHEPLVGLMQHLNDSLFDLKETRMFATLACLRQTTEGRVEYSLAGHPPILHYHFASHTISQLRMEQFPIAMFRNIDFRSSTVQLAPGDLLAVVSDGVLEITNAQGNELGWNGFEELILRNAKSPLTQILDQVIKHTSGYGIQEDDQTLLLIRARTVIS